MIENSNSFSPKRFLETSLRGDRMVSKLYCILFEQMLAEPNCYPGFVRFQGRQLCAMAS